MLVVFSAIGKGDPTKPGRVVKITYEGMFPDGRVFDKNQSTKHPFSFRLGAGEVVRGMDTGVEGMRVGGCRELIIPPELGYVFRTICLSARAMFAIDAIRETGQ
jgi:FKBP-type peptidyl-prolyl cis-trans isomerase